MASRSQGQRYSSVARAATAAFDDAPVVRASIRTRALRLLCVLAAAGVLWRTRVPAHLLAPRQLFWAAYCVGTAASAVFLAIILYVLVAKYVLRRGIDYLRWRASSPRSVALLTASAVAAYFGYSAAFWPVYGVWSPLLFAFLSYAALCALSFV